MANRAPASGSRPPSAPPPAVRWHVARPEGQAELHGPSPQAEANLTTLPSQDMDQTISLSLRDVDRTRAPSELQRMMGQFGMPQPPPLAAEPGAAAGASRPPPSPPRSPQRSLGAPSAAGTQVLGTAVSVVETLEEVGASMVLREPPFAAAAPPVGQTRPATQRGRATGADAGRAAADLLGGTVPVQEFHQVVAELPSTCDLVPCADALPTRSQDRPPATEWCSETPPPAAVAFPLAEGGRAPEEEWRPPAPSQRPPRAPAGASAAG
ncbi:unnamed protein product [Prorocentrum cordatum]|uniref:Uncharacterized protein n=1 Tax=Prorocentrum cordatum TaxID=2364126 RepID=A0ABN9TYC4_9DINO|nr:unnamed protein product [Polarella glacialis]